MTPPLLLPRRGKLLGFIRLQCRVKPLARPRLFSSARFDERVYQPLENQAEFRQLLSAVEPLWIDEPVIVDSYVAMRRSKRLQFPASAHYGDIDNIAKAIYDGLQSTNMILNDGLILGGESLKLFGPEDSVEIKIYAVAHEPEEAAA